MPAKEKTFVVILVFVFLFSLTQYFVTRNKLSFSTGGDVYVEGFVGTLRLINPVFADFNDADRDAAELIFSGLIRYDPVQKNFFPDLAESFERSRDGLTYTFKLRTNVVWHDGEAFTADDVIYTYKEVIQDPSFRNPVLRNSFEDIKIDKLDPERVAFVLPSPNSYFISHLTVGILPRHILNETPVSSLDRSSFNKEPIGTGPYAFADGTY